MKRTWIAGSALFVGYIVVACGGTGGGSGTGGAVCGNGTVEIGEACDGQDFAGQTCKTLKQEGGQLACTATCTVDTKSCCTSKCVNAGDTQCDKNVLKTCGLQPSGCRDYTTKDCAATGGTCEIVNGKAACKTDCTDECALAGQKQCNGATLETCTLAASGCREWEVTEDCSASGKSCDPSAGQCSTGCANQCATVGATQCSGTAVQTCTSTGGGCNSWVTSTDCSTTGKSCTVTGGVASCGTACAPGGCTTGGTQTCLSNVLSTCTADTNGCLTWVSTQNCTSTNTYCKLKGGGTAACEPVCVDPCVTVGEKKCNANVIMECKLDPNGCKEWKISQTCPLGQTCSASGTNYSCVTAPPTGEDCGTALVVKAGVNNLSFTNVTNNYLNPKPACLYTSVASGQGDIVLAYQATITGSVDFTVSKPVSSYMGVIAAGGTCGNLSQQLVCNTGTNPSDYSNTSTSGSFPISAGSTYFFYIARLSSGTLTSPLTMTIAEVNCATFAASAVTLSPANGGTSSSLLPKLQVDFDVGVTTNVGTVTITGNKGTNLSYNLSTTNAAIAWSNANKTLTISPTAPFPAGELVTVNLNGLVDAKCTKPITKPAWSFTVITPPCAPGTGGMVGATQTKLTGPGTTIYYMGTDTQPNGYVYFGHTSQMWRLGKTSGTLSTVSNDSTFLGYGMLMNGDDPFSIEYKLSIGAGYLWKLIGVPASGQDHMSFTTAPGDYFRSGVAYKGKLYLITGESSTTIPTEIWSVPVPPPSYPYPAVKELQFTGEAYCNGLAMDDTYYYATCGNLERLVKIHRTSGAVTLITNSFDLYNGTYTNGIAAHDNNNDGTADFLYFKGARAEAYYVCNPGGTTPYADKLASWGTSTSNYGGLAFDAVNKKLYSFDSATYGIVQIQ